MHADAQNKSCHLADKSDDCISNITVMYGYVSLLVLTLFVCDNFSILGCSLERLASNRVAYGALYSH